MFYDGECGQQSDESNRSIHVDGSCCVKALLAQVREIIRSPQRVRHLNHRCDNDCADDAVHQRPELLLRFYEAPCQKKHRGELKHLIKISEHQRNLVASPNPIDCTETCHQAQHRRNAKRLTLEKILKSINQHASRKAVSDEQGSNGRGVFRIQEAGYGAYEVSKGKGETYERPKHESQ